MASPGDRINPNHTKVRALLRVLGPIVLAAGLLCAVAAFVSFARAFGGSGPPRLFWLGFVGLPLIFVGGVLCKYGFMGAVSRYAAGEQAPVAADTLNYLAEETRPGVRAGASAVREGLRGEGRACPACGERNDGEARFCDACGKPLARGCPACEAQNDADARFCDACGAALG
ncbi:MAG: zinc ribbon domain-containing protein [Phycisphaerales bacterium]|nr:zinc ribbon domain-containing protein [Phycisphaerales bacterium]